MSHGTGMFVSVPLAQRRRLAALARGRRLSTSELIRQALAHWLDAGAPAAEQSDDDEPLPPRPRTTKRDDDARPEEEPRSPERGGHAAPAISGTQHTDTCNRGVAMSSSHDRELVTLRPEQRRRLRELARSRGASSGELIRFAVEHWLRSGAPTPTDRLALVVERRRRRAVEDEVRELDERLDEILGDPRA